MVAPGAMHENKRLTGAAALVVQLDAIDARGGHSGLPDGASLSGRARQRRSAPRGSRPCGTVSRRSDVLDVRSSVRCTTVAHTAIPHARPPVVSGIATEKHGASSRSHAGRSFGPCTADRLIGGVKEQKRGAIAAERGLAHGGDEPGHRVAGVPASTPYRDVSG